MGVRVRVCMFVGVYCVHVCLCVITEEEEEKKTGSYQKPLFLPNETIT